LPVAQVGERDTTEPTTSNRAQLAAVNQPPNSALVRAKQTRRLLDTDLERLKLRTILDRDQTLRRVFDSLVVHLFPLLTAWRNHTHSASVASAL
jgi:hypothetical protein